MILGFTDFNGTCDLLARSKVLRKSDSPDGGTCYLTESPLSNFPPIRPIFHGPPPLARLPAWAFGDTTVDLAIYQSVIDGSAMVCIYPRRPDSAHECVRALDGPR